MTNRRDYSLLKVVADIRVFKRFCHGKWN